jgi:hypothetical protein
VDGKDIRKAEWNNKEVRVSYLPLFYIHNHTMKKSNLLETQLVEKGVTPQYIP